MLTTSAGLMVLGMHLIIASIASEFTEWPRLRCETRSDGRSLFSYMEPCLATALLDKDVLETASAKDMWEVEPDGA